MFSSLGARTFSPNAGQCSDNGSPDGTPRRYVPDIWVIFHTGDADRKLERFDNTFSFATTTDHYNVC